MQKHQRPDCSTCLHRTWLADIVDAFMRRPDGIAEVKAIVFEIMRGDRDMKETPEEMVTRTINNHCRDAKDVGRDVKHDLFERVAPGTYRLRSWPNRPDLIEIQDISFVDDACQRTWQDFNDMARRQNAAKFAAMTNKQRLEIFFKEVAPGGKFHNLLEAYRDAYSLELNI